MCVREDPACTSFARPPTVIPEPHAAATMDKQIVVRKKHIVAKQIELSASDSDDSDYVATPDAVARGSESDDGSSEWTKCNGGSGRTTTRRCTGAGARPLIIYVRKNHPRPGPPKSNFSDLVGVCLGSKYTSLLR